MGLRKGARDWVEIGAEFRGAEMTVSAAARSTSVWARIPPGGRGLRCGIGGGVSRTAEPANSQDRQRSWLEAYRIDKLH